MSRPQIALLSAEMGADTRRSLSDRVAQQFVPEAPVPLPAAGNDLAPLVHPRSTRPRLLLPMTILMAASIGTIALLKARAPRENLSPAEEGRPPYSLTAAWRGIGQRSAREAVHPGVLPPEALVRPIIEGSPAAPPMPVALESTAPPSTVDRHLTEIAPDSIAAVPETVADASHPASVNSDSVAATAVAPFGPPADASTDDADLLPRTTCCPAIEASEPMPPKDDHRPAQSNSTAETAPPMQEPRQERGDNTVALQSSAPPLPRRKPTVTPRPALSEVSMRRQPVRSVRKAAQSTILQAASAPGAADVFRELDYTVP